VIRMDSPFVVVDGSNIATEGRSTPSLSQLDDAVHALQEQLPDKQVIVVVDATFGHRIDPSERDAFDEAVAHSEIVSPPAGAIGRGDAFLLRVAERVAAQVLSNDSFQEFHGEHPWLFEEGRLMGGTPVPGVGWIFTPRTPVRGARSRAAVEAAKKVSSTTAARARKAEKKAPAAEKARKSTEKEPAPQKKATTADTAVPATKKTAAKKPPPQKKQTPRKKQTAETAPPRRATATETPQARKAKTTKMASPVEDRTVRGSKLVGVQEPPAPAAKKRSKASEASASQKPSRVNESRGRRAGRRRTASHEVEAAIEVATEEVLVPGDAPIVEKRSATGRGRRKGPPPAVNDPLTFLTFVSEHAIGSVVGGTVRSFTSHGAMVDVGDMHCYAPLAGLARPAPRRAREVLERGEDRRFVLVALDPSRRAAELALPELATGTA